MVVVSFFAPGVCVLRGVVAIKKPHHWLIGLMCGVSCSGLLGDYLNFNGAYESKVIIDHLFNRLPSGLNTPSPSATRHVIIAMQ